MKIYFIFVTGIMALLWILTLFAILIYYKKKLSQKKDTTSSDILLSMISEKYQETLHATTKLIEVANFLKIGLIEYKNNNLINLNDIKSIFNIDEDTINNITKEIDIKQSNPKTLIYNDLAFQINYLKLTENYYIILIQDVSETYFMALKLKESEKFAILGQITAQMAHQLKTQLAILAGKAQLLSKKFSDFEPDISKSINEIFLRSRDISDKINQIVAIYKQNQIKEEPFNITNFLIDLKNEIKLLHQNINIIINSSEDLIINTDINLLKNIIFLIIQNSLHHQSQTTQITLSLISENNHTILTINDNGTGIPDNIKEKIFQPFYTTKEDGMGLGLFLAKDLANLINIDITNDDVPNGAQFRIIIPEI
jgi:signal transduction histidine kinase